MHEHLLSELISYPITGIQNPLSEVCGQKPPTTDPFHDTNLFLALITINHGVIKPAYSISRRLANPDRPSPSEPTMEVSFLPLELSSVDELQTSLKDLDESILTTDNKVYLHHGPNSVAIKRQKKHNGANGTVRHDRTLVDLIREEWRPFESPFHPHPLLQTGQLQTIYAGARNFDDLAPIRYARKLLTMHDGGTIGLDIVLDSEEQYTKGLEIDEEITKRKDYVKNLPPRIRYMQAAEEPELLQSDDGRPMLVSLHGLSGGSHETYVRALLHEIVKSGRWKACCLNSRGCGRTNITTQQLFCGNWTGRDSHAIFP